MLLILFLILLDYLINDFTTLSAHNKNLVLLSDGCIKICIYFIMSGSGMIAAARSQKVKVKVNGYRTHYDCIYDALLYLKSQPNPLTKYRISTNKHTLLSLLSNQFIKPVTNKNLILNSGYTDVLHFIISPKGIEYIERYESLKQLFS